jgi:hypothetical protein
MKTYYLLLFFLSSFLCNAQVETETPFVYIIRDTVTNTCQARIYYNGTHYVNVHTGIKTYWPHNIKVKYNTRFTFVWKPNSTLVITGKNFIKRVKVL